MVMFNATGKCVVLLATYNGENFLAEQLDSIYAQEHVCTLVVARDDGSTDNTVKILERYEGSHGLILLRDTSDGGSAAKNFRHIVLAANVEDAAVVFFSDQDDIWLPDKMYTALKKVEEGADLYSCSLIPFDLERGEMRILKEKINPVRFDHLFQGLSAGCTYALSPRFFSIVKSTFLDPWYGTSGFSHDWLIYTLVRANDMLFHHDPIPRVLYRQHSSNVQGAAAGFDGFLYRLKNINAGWYFEQMVKNKSFFHSTSPEAIIIDAVSARDMGLLLRNLRNLRRSFTESVVLVTFAFLRSDSSD